MASLRAHWQAIATVVVLAVLGLTLWATGAFKASATSSRQDVVVSSHRLRLGPPQPVYFGAEIKYNNGQAPYDMSAATEFAQHAGKKVSMISFGSAFQAAYCNGDCGFDVARFQAIRDYGAIPFFSWAPPTTKFVDAKIAAGAEDRYLRKWAEAAKSWGHPFFLRLAWEMNGRWAPWGLGNSAQNTARAFVAMWRHVHSVFARVGAHNVTWVWCPNIVGPNTYPYLSQLYPGDDVVDWTCLDGYNGNDPWREFVPLYRPSYQAVANIAPGKPMMLGETASTEVGGQKSVWISRMLASLPIAFPRVRGFVWSDDHYRGPGGNTDWAIESSPSAMAAFARGISNPVYRTNSYSGLRTSPIPAPRRRAP